MVTTDKGTYSEGPAGVPAGPSLVPGGAARLTLIGVTVALLAETLRYSLPVFVELSVGKALAVALPVALVPFLAPVLRPLLGPRVLTALGIGGLLLSRLVAQGLGPVLDLAAAATALGLLALPALYESARGLSGVGFAIAATAGLALDTSLRMLFGTWDAAWQSTPAAWAVCLLLVGTGVAALARELASGVVPPPGISWRDALGAAALGPFLALQVLVLSSPAFVASSGWLSLTTAHLAVLAGQALALAFLASGLAVRAVPGGVCVLGGTVLGVCAGAVAGTYALQGRAIIFAVVPAQVLAAWLLAVACRAPLRRAGEGGPIWRVDVGAALGGFVLLAILVPYTLNPAHPLPFPNNALSAVAGILIGLLASIAASRGGPLPARAPQRAVAALVASLVLALPTAVFAMSVDEADGSADERRLRVVSYNIRQAMHDGKLDPEYVARGIEEQKANVVALQDVGRGAVASGTADLGVWLSRRLGMTLVWGPATDAQYGNAILTSLEVDSSGGGRVFSGEQIRGYVWARLRTADGTVDVWTTRLAPGEEKAAHRRAELSELVRAWSRAPRTIITGDMGVALGGGGLQPLNGTGLRRAAGARQSGSQGVFCTDDLVFSEAVNPRDGMVAVTAEAG